MCGLFSALFGSKKQKAWTEPIVNPASQPRPTRSSTTQPQPQWQAPRTASVPISIQQGASQPAKHWTRPDDYNSQCPYHDEEAAFQAQYYLHGKYGKSWRSPPESSHILVSPPGIPVPMRSADSVWAVTCGPHRTGPQRKVHFDESQRRPLSRTN
ncbi:hypothetical protein MRS44_014196 [Fusarium solani]|jgi:hypothetical protein|uniref:uncharacterized protein n=1 Tax=Fusarium solani TaxID=169388 RepID=UPI0032C49A8B|nr:hypothetical protein MRS44_014196 [Fusarium solani]